jgi:hypothetical protein
VDPTDGASRYDAAWIRLDSGRVAPALVAVSEAMGVANLELLDPASGATRPLTSVTGAALSPEPTHDARSVYFLSLHATGLDLNRVRAEQPPVPVVRLDPRLAPAARALAVGVPDTFPTNPVSTPHAYGLGPRRERIFPAGGYTAEGGYGALFLGSTDPVGRLTWLLQGAYGDHRTWRGAALGAAWRGWRPQLGGDLFYAEQRPSPPGVGGIIAPSLAVRYTGAMLTLGLTHDRGSRQSVERIGASYGVLAGLPVHTPLQPPLQTPLRSDARRLVFAEWAGGFAERAEQATFALSATVQGAAGVTDRVDWQRAVGTLAIRVGMGTQALSAAVTYGETSRGAPEYERLIVGGAPPPLFDPALLSQRLTHPGLPLGYAGGRRALAVRGGATLLGLEPYLWIVSAGEDLVRWQRVIGTEQTLAIPALPLVFLPSTILQAGVAYSLDEPVRHQTRAYLVLRFRP